MKTLLIPLLALAASPAVADIYRCTSGHKTVYQDVPCANAKRVENPNGLPPSPAEQKKAFDRAANDQAALARLRQQRQIEEQMASRRQAVSTVPVAPAAPSYQPNNTSGRPDRYYDRPDRYRDRHTESYTTNHR